MTADTPLARLATLAGILPGYRDALGADHVMSDATRIALLRAMHIAADTPDAVEHSLRRLEQEPWLRMTEPVLVVRVKRGTRALIPVILSADRAATTITWVFQAENGKSRKGAVRFADLPLHESREIAGLVRERRILILPFAPMIGRHRLELRAESGEQASLPLIVAPQRCWLPPADGGDPRLWGLTLQLYGLRSERNWGIGDFADLAQLAETVAPLGASAVGLNPLHAMFPHWPNHRSPYSPSHRQFLAVHYLSVDRMEDFAECDEARRIMARDDMGQRLDAARHSALVDYDQVLVLKQPIFELLYRSFRDRHLAHDDDTRARAFRDFQAAKGEALRAFAVFGALSDRFTGEPWQRWPAVFRDPASPEVAGFAEQNRARVEFHQYLQWQCDTQLNGAQTTAQAAGMRLGLYHDLALAPDGSGAEAWANQSLFARGATLGAPPDLWNQFGQNWGLPPYVPLALRTDAYGQLSGVIHAIMSHGGALRVDHAIGLERMFWIPEGAGPAEGGYVRYPVDDLFGVLALASVREQSVIIGEDLGTLPEGFHERMQSAAMLSYRLLYFQQDKRGRFIPPRRYPPLATVAVSTHDLATLAGYWQGHDLDVRAALDQFPSEEMKTASFRLRDKDRRALLRALRDEGLLPRDMPDDRIPFDDLLTAIYRFVARAPSLLMLLSLEDVAGEREQANLPGTVDQHPNWQRKLSLSLEELKYSGRLRALARAIVDERGSRPADSGERRDAQS